MTQLNNASQHAKMFYCRHMVPGVARYNHADIYVPMDVMLKMAKTFNGKPVFVDHQDVEIQNIQSRADGYVVDTFLLPEDGWLWSKMIMTSDAGIAAAMNPEYKVSNAHVPIEYGPGGTFINMPYQKSVKASQFTHNALVKNPRYEGALIKTPEEFIDYKKQLVSQSNELHNSKTNGVKRMLKMFSLKKEEVSTIDEDTMMELENGTTVKVSDMIKAIELQNAAEAAAKEAEEKKLKESELENHKEVEVDGVKMPLVDLVAKFTKLQNEKDAADAEKEAADKKAAEEQKVIDDAAAAQKAKDDAEAAADEQKKFDELNNAADNNEVQPIVIQTASDQEAIGRERY